MRLTTEHLSTPELCILVSSVLSGLLTWVIWADGTFFYLSPTVKELLPRPLVMLAIFWLHWIPLLFLPDRYRGARQL